MISFLRTRMIVPLVIAAIGITAVPVHSSANPSIPGSTSGIDGPIWIPNYGTGSVFAIDAATMAVQTEIPHVGDHSMVIKEVPDHSRLFVGNFGPFNWNVSVIDVATQTVIKRIPTIGPAYAVIQMSHDGRYVFVPTGLSVVSVIDTQTLDVVRTLPVLLPPGPSHMELSADDSTMYVFSPATATAYDAHTGAVLAPPIVLNGFMPGWGAISADGDLLYAVNFWSGITIVDTRSWSVVRTILLPVDGGPISATLTPDGSTLWVCDYMGKEMYVLNARTGEILRRIPTPDRNPVYVGFSSDGATAYVTLVSEGVPLPYWTPLTGQYTTSFEAYWAKLLQLDTFLVAYDTEQATPGREMTVKGAFVAGVYPG